ncbi:restriction endonuclease subunit S [Winogradskyella undariae]|uniref:restriction endonuclease subunit S n=1 Tax=Winogradskyella undariae TaxID=1285465 RepID=UPI00156B2A08|nr:restriction endonuclease subunit S [Winogradskyella undariae]NRR92781.1 restriction endonuclease subunit S [Winogradskyella undariae]
MENKLPKNWVETEFKELTAFVIGGDWGKDLEFEFDVDSEIVSCIRGSEIKNWERDKGSTASIRKIKSASLEKRALVEGDILLEISGGGPDQPVGRTIYIDEEALDVNIDCKKVCTNFLRMVRLYDNLDKKFIKHYLDSFYLSGEILKYQGGSNNLRNLKYKEFETIKIPLPPLAEQQRIVTKLDELFGHLDTLKTRLNHIPQILKNFRQAVLTQAVTGKLTEEWRVGKDLEEWEETTLEHLVLFAGNGLSKRSGEGEDLTVLRLADFKNGIRVFGNERKIQLTEKERIKYTLNNNDLLIIRVNGSVDLAGLFILYNNEGIKEAFCDHFIRLTVDSERIIPLYLTYISNNGDGRLYLKNSLSTSAGQNTINQKSVKGLSINLPSLEEQTEIVKRVEHLFAKAEAIEAQYQSLKTKIDSLPQAILAKAFKGELVAQLDTDGSAAMLLEEIQKMKASLRGTKQSVKRKKK